MRTILLAMAAWVLLLGSARAADDTTEEAKNLYKEAQSHYALGEFRQAADKYKEAYRLKPDAAFLFNAAQSFRQAGEPEQALTLYRSFIRFYPDNGNVDVARDQIAKLERASGTRTPSAADPAPTPTPAIAEVPPAPAVVIASAPAPVEAASGPNYLLWGGIAAGIVAIVAIIVVGSSSEDPWRTRDDFGPGVRP